MAQQEQEDQLQKVDGVSRMPMALHEDGRSGSSERNLQDQSVAIYSDAADAIISVDASHRITTLNDVARMMFGYSVEEIIGAPLELLIP